MPRTAAIILAAGRGTRAGGALAKQWQPLGGQRVLDWTLAAFRQVPELVRLVLVVHPQDTDLVGDTDGVLVVPGGDTRAASVRAGLAALDGTDVSHVLIHDGARPLVSQRVISDILDALAYAPAAAPALEVTDALWSGRDGSVTGIRDRTGLYRAQTPQGFDLAAIRAAHDRFTGEPADDVEVALADGLDVVMIPGEERNLKITRPEDFGRAEMLLGHGMDIRMGNGFDVHAFGKGDHVTLCGVRVPFGRGLQGHSDADVGMHAVTDAIYGALAMGDIGRHFPPTDDRWKGADSATFLRHAVDLAAAQGYLLSNIDLTLICERPKIGPHAHEMTNRMAQILRVDPSRVSIKATTSERLGFTGREEGIAAIATAVLTGR